MRGITWLVAIWFIISIIVQLALGILATILIHKDTKDFVNLFNFMIFVLSIFLIFVLCCWLSSNRAKKKFAGIIGIIYGIFQIQFLLERES